MKRQDIQNLSLPPGGRIEFDMSMDRYHAEPGLNFSTLKHMAQSPLAYKTNIETRTGKSSAAMDLGSAAHLAILEPLKLDDEIAVWDGRKSGNAWKEFKDQNSDKLILKQEELRCVWDMAAATMKHPAASESFDGALKEVSIFWTDTKTGLECKARLDSVSERFLPDLKTTADVDPWKFQTLAGRFMYHAQLAWYSDGWQALTGIRNTPVRLVTVCSKAPHDVVVYNVPGPVLDAGLDLCRGWLVKLMECNKTGEWPGISNESIEFALPGWMYPDLESDNKEQPF